MTVLTLIQAINAALKQEMSRDSTVVVLGEDVGRDGGVFRATDGLWQAFRDRVIDTPLAESAIVGSSIGLAMNGMKPVAEIQFDGFLAPAYDQLINHASRIRWRSRGRFHVPLVLRVPYGGGIKALEHHSESPEAYLTHTPGLKVVVPSTPYDAKGLLLSAIRDPDPVVYLEPKRLYRAVKQEVPEEDYVVPIGQANIVQEGTDVTLIGWGAMVRVLQEAAQKSSVSCEVVDLRTLSPMDEKTIIASVEKTGRAVVVHEDQRMNGIGAEVSSIIQEKAFLSLEAPVQRVTGYDIIFPLPKLENYYIPDANRVLKAIKTVMEF